MVHSTKDMGADKSPKPASFQQQKQYMKCPYMLSSGLHHIPAPPRAWKAAYIYTMHANGHKPRVNSYLIKHGMADGQPSQATKIKDATWRG